MRLRPLLPLFAFLALFLSLIIPAAHASVTVANTSSRDITSISSCHPSCGESTASLTVSASGDLLVAIETVVGQAGCASGHYSFSFSTSTNSYPWVQDGSLVCVNVAGGWSIQSTVWHTVSTSNAAETLGLLWTDTGSQTSMTGTLQAFDVQGTSGTTPLVTTASGTFTNSGGTGSLAAGVNYGIGSFLVGSTSAVSGGGGLAITAGGGFSQLGGCTTARACTQYGTDSVVPSPSTFPFTAATCGGACTTSWGELTVVYGVGQSTGGTANLGSCPTKNTATQTLANLTEYFYTGSWLQNQVVNNETIEVTSVNSGHSASEQMYLTIYLTPSAGSISVSNPLTLAAQKFFLLSATSAPQKISWSAGFSANFIPAGATIGIAVIGNSKIVINQSSLAGMQTGTSGAVPGGGTTGIPAAQFNALSANAAQLYFCANSSFQTVVTTTVTSTVTTSVTTTTAGTATTTSTITTTLSSIDANAAAGTTTGFTLILLVTLIPAVVLGGILALTRSGPLTLGGFIAGLAIGAGAGNLSGIVPIQFVAIIVVAIVLLIVFGVMVLRGGGGGT